MNHGKKKKAKKAGTIKGKPEIPVIDLFAGPGGLSEGFSAYKGSFVFDPKLSIEKDEWAHRTLELRHLFRRLKRRGTVPTAYYQYIKGEGVTREELFDQFPSEAADAKKAAMLATLGEMPLAEVVKSIKRALKGNKNWVLLGGPPCQAYSMMGRSRMKGSETFSEDHRHTLYREYLKIVATLHPVVFVMENVKGILSSKLNGEKIFGRILEDLRNPLDALSEEDLSGVQLDKRYYKYRIYSFVKSVTDENELNHDDYLIKAEQYGVPQARHRVILLGVRSDHDMDKLHPVLKPREELTTLQQVIGDMPQIRSRLTRGDQDKKLWFSRLKKCLKYSQLNTRKNSEVFQKMVDSLAHMPEEVGEGGQLVTGGKEPEALSDWLLDKKLDSVVQHESRGHMDSDFCRYLFSSCYALVYGVAPKLEDFPESLWPKHANAVLEANGRVAKFRDRFRVQVTDRPSTTVTAHLHKDGHYFIHPDPCQCRSITVREAARLQTFPDNYFFEGTRTKQFQQVGNAVPPYLAFQLADVVAKILEFNRKKVDQQTRSSKGYGKKSRRV